MNNSNYKNGTKLCAEAAQILNLNDNDVIINIQGDEPMANTNDINSVTVNFY